MRSWTVPLLPWTIRHKMFLVSRTHQSNQWSWGFTALCSFCGGSKNCVLYSSLSDRVHERLIECWTELRTGSERICDAFTRAYDYCFVDTGVALFRLRLQLAWHALRLENCLCKYEWHEFRFLCLARRWYQLRSRKKSCFARTMCQWFNNLFLSYLCTSLSGIASVLFFFCFGWQCFFSIFMVSPKPVDALSCIVFVWPFLCSQLIQSISVLHSFFFCNQ